MMLGTRLTQGRAGIEHGSVPAHALEAPSMNQWRVVSSTHWPLDFEASKGALDAMSLAGANRAELLRVSLSLRVLAARLVELDERGEDITVTRMGGER